MKIKPIVVFDKRILSFIPFKHVVVPTSLTLDDAVELLSSSISPAFSPISNPLPNSKRFQGNVSEQGFRIRVTDYYRGSLTWVVGKFIPDDNGLKIDMYVRPNPIVFLSPLFIGGAIYALLQSIKENNYFDVFWSLLAIIIFSLWHFFETDTLDWFIGNLIGLYIIEDKK